ncbi:hypothetical protein VFPPC_06923 [Pochonia chlamydosporia 170]|uniref:Uncharacterized protein n=1 Tax=Pochonia chlamydosporia 170 TaxID=1380566 RepID=A0A179FAG2_METCM|nr:hypothetical protein VFPPC_06923 [Pochonia chlamydosporia 170]OAQ62454.1 hypothetical protein VFPPC_06923 [Pochonia chlamydosporia 170]
MMSNVFQLTIAAFAFTTLVTAVPQQYPNKCGDQVCPSDKPKCCAVNVNGVEELGCFASCPSQPKPLQRRQQGVECGDSIFCKPNQLCCAVIYNGVEERGCYDGPTCPPLNPATTMTTITTTTPAAAAATFGPKCGDSFFCPVGKVCCPNKLYTCADTVDQCPK